MRSKRLRKRGHSFIKNQQEVKKKQHTWGKYLYLAVLFIIICIIIQWGYDKIFYVNGEGFLESETNYIEARTPSRIMKINCKINDQVAPGQPLVLLGNPGKNKNGIGLNYNHDRKIIETQSKINLLKQEIAQNIEETRILKDEYKKASELLVIHAITRSQLLSIEDKLKNSENKLKMLNIQLDAGVRILKTYENPNYLHATNGNGQYNLQLASNNESVLHAPNEGVVSIIYKQKGEVAKTGEPILKIVNKNKNFIMTYFAESYEKSIQLGYEAKIYFKNGEKSRGIIRKIYPTAVTQPYEFKKRFGSVQRYIIAEIAPKDFQSWDRILETKVKVLVKKKWF